MDKIDIIKLDNILNFLKSNDVNLYKNFEKKYKSIYQFFQTENLYEKTQLVEDFIMNHNIFDEIIKTDDL